MKIYLKICSRTGNISEKLPIINTEANQFGKSGLLAQLAESDQTRKAKRFLI
jgi:hypothetical protein